MNIEPTDKTSKKPNKIENDVFRLAAFTNVFFTSKCHTVPRFAPEYNLFYDNNKSKAPFLLIFTK